MALAIKPFEEKHTDAVIALWAACDLVRPWNDPHKDIAFAIEQDNSTILLGWARDRLAASVMVGHDGHRGIVYYVSVDPNSQGKGFGREIMAAAETWLIDRGVWKLNLMMRPENTGVRKFYESLGYEVEPRLCMARRLIPAASEQR